MGPLERQMFYSFHCFRAIVEGWRPLTEAQYDTLCAKIEGGFPYTMPGRR